MTMRNRSSLSLVVLMSAALTSCAENPRPLVEEVAVPGIDAVDQDKVEEFFATMDHCHEIQMNSPLMSMRVLEIDPSRSQSKSFRSFDARIRMSTWPTTWISSNSSTRSCILLTTPAQRVEAGCA
jgi:hypothetical protein